MKKAIDLRYELAQLFDKDSYAYVALKDRMAKTPEAVNSFLDEVYAKVAPLEKQDVEELRQFKAETLKFRWKKQRLSAGAKATGVKNCVRPNIRWIRKNCVIISRLKRRKMVICHIFRFIWD